MKNPKRKVTSEFFHIKTWTWTSDSEKARKVEKVKNKFQFVRRTLQSFSCIVQWKNKATFRIWNRWIFIFIYSVIFVSFFLSRVGLKMNECEKLFSLFPTNESGRKEKKWKVELKKKSKWKCLLCCRQCRRYLKIYCRHCILSVFTQCVYNFK